MLNLPIIIVNDYLTQKIKNGQKLENTWKIEDKVIFKNENNELLGIYEKKEERLAVWKNFI